MLAGLFIGLAILTKGPVALLISLLVLIVFRIAFGTIKFMKLKDFLAFILIAGITSFAWFGIETLRHGPWFLVSFIQYQVRLLTTPDAGHGGPISYHLFVLLLGCFPASVFLVRRWKDSGDSPLGNFSRWMKILFLTVLVLFSIVETKIVHYSSLCWLPLTFLAAVYIYSVLHREQKLYWAVLASLIIIGVCFGIAITALPYIGMHQSLLEPWIKDSFGKASLEARVNWNSLEYIPGIAYLLSLLIGVILILRKTTKLRGVLVIFIATGLLVQIVSFVFVPKIEGYSQRAEIEFFQQKAGKDVYVNSLGYKSYAPYFYGRTKTRIPSSDSLLNHNFSKDIYFVSRVDRMGPYLEKYNLLRLQEKNGFVLLMKVGEDSDKCIKE
jgi:hypothetical protein